MPCSVTIQDVTGITGPTPGAVEIRVTGMAVADPAPTLVEVRLELKDRNGNVTHATPTINEPVSGIVWEAVFRSGDHYAIARCADASDWLETRYLAPALRARLAPAEF